MKVHVKVISPANIVMDEETIDMDQVAEAVDDLIQRYPGHTIEIVGIEDEGEDT